MNTDRDERGNSLLLTAAQNGLKRIVKLLLRKGADINARVRGGLTLWWCRRRRLLALVQLSATQLVAIFLSH